MSTAPKSLIQRVTEEANANPEFMKRLEADPRAAIESMTGGKLPEGLNVQVVRNSPTNMTIVLPGERNASGELSDAELSRVAGGWTYCWATSPVCWDTQDCFFFTA